MRRKRRNERTLAVAAIILPIDSASADRCAGRSAGNPSPLGKRIIRRQPRYYFGDYASRSQYAVGVRPKMWQNGYCAIEHHTTGRIITSEIE